MAAGRVIEVSVPEGAEAELSKQRTAVRCFDQTPSRFDRPGVPVETVSSRSLDAIQYSVTNIMERAVIRRDGGIEPRSCTEALLTALCLLLRLTPDQPIQVRDH